MAEQATFGDRLRNIRKRRGLTQSELAKRAGVSISLVRRLEQGEQEHTRIETARKFAIALRIQTSELVARPDADKASPKSVDDWKPVRDALLGKVEIDSAEAATSEGVNKSFTDLMPAFRLDKYSEISPMLPALLRDADQLGSEGREVRTRLLHMTGWLLTHTHQYDAANTALRRALDDAPNRLDATAIVNGLCWLLIRQGKLDECIQLASRWADDVEPRFSRATPDELSAWGWLHIRISTAAARDNRPGEAEDSLKLARAAAVRIGREVQPKGEFHRSFGPTMVALKTAENLIIDDRPDRVIALSAGIKNGKQKADFRNWNRHLLDVAEANTRMGAYSDALDKLFEVKSNSPEWIIEQRYARDILGKVIKRRRSLTPEMRELAGFIRLPY